MTFLVVYTDPGSGIMLLQVLLASIAGALFYFRSIFLKLFRKDKTTDTLQNSEEESPERTQNDGNEV